MPWQNCGEYRLVYYLANGRRKNSPNITRHPPATSDYFLIFPSTFLPCVSTNFCVFHSDLVSHVVNALCFDKFCVFRSDLIWYHMLSTRFVSTQLRVSPSDLSPQLVVVRVRGDAFRVRISVHNNCMFFRRFQRVPRAILRRRRKLCFSVNEMCR